MGYDRNARDGHGIYIAVAGVGMKSSKPIPKLNVLFESTIPDYQQQPLASPIKRLYTKLVRREKQVIEKIVDRFLEMKKETAHYSRTKVPRCFDCKKNMVKIDKYQWKHNCKCSDAVLMIG